MWGLGRRKRRNKGERREEGRGKERKGRLGGEEGRREE